MGTRLLIIGGVAGGATAAARARRIDEAAEILLFERGEYISFANCGLPYYIGDVIRSRESLLVTTPQAFSERYRIDIRVFHEVLAIDRANKSLRVKDLTTGHIYEEQYDKVILSPGSEPIKPAIKGIHTEGVFSVRSIPDSDRIRKMVVEKKPREAVVVGGGYRTYLGAKDRIMEESG